jgi:hypothetical protein
VRLRIAIRLVTIAVVVGLTGVGLSAALPNRYTANGLLVVTRKADAPATEVFTYEGYYAQQSAEVYTTTFLAILQSPDNLALADTTSNPKRLARLIKAKRDGTHAISLAVKGQTAKDAVYLWERVATAASQTHSKLTTPSDPLLAVTKTPGSPVVLATYPEWPAVFGVSFTFSLLGMIATHVLLKYLKEARVD